MGLLIRDARVVTMAGRAGPRRGGGMRRLGIVERANVLVRSGVVESVTPVPDDTPPTAPAPAGVSRLVEARGRVLMPAFVDCHTHACWAGERVGEWEARLRGADYLDILKAGGGIMATVRAVRAASEQELADGLAARLALALRWGTTTVEVKSGYGLTTADELKMLRAIRRAAEGWPGTVVATACIGHAIDPDRPRGEFVRGTIEETLPAVCAEFPGIAVDAYCEDGLWSFDECLSLFEEAARLGHPCRVHADQFTRLGLTAEAARRGFASVDHLEASVPEDTKALAHSRTIGVLLPCSGFHLDGRYADGRALIDAGAAVALGTNWNPGSAPCGSAPMAIALAVRHCGLTPAEAITAATANSAAVLGLNDRGVIAPGARADFVLLRHTDERALAWEFGGNAVDTVICYGNLVA